MKRVFLRIWIGLLFGVSAYSGFGYGQIAISELESEIVELERKIELLEMRVSQLEKNLVEPTDAVLGQHGTTSTSAQEGREGSVILWDDPSQGREPTSMPQPQIPAWVSEQGLSLRVVVSFELTPQGVLREVKVEQGSGYSDVDAAVLEALRRWQFRPVSSTHSVTGRLTYTIIPGLRSGLRFLDSPSPPTSQAAPTGAPWKDKQNWRRLQRGMSRDAVVRILGDPETIRKYSSFETWHYPLGGHVSFDEAGRITSWFEP